MTSIDETVTNSDETVTNIDETMANRDETVTSIDETMKSIDETMKSIDETMKILVNDSNCKIIISQIIDNFNDLALFFGSDTETIVNCAQRKFKSRHRQFEWLTSRAIIRKELGPDVSILYHENGKPYLCNSDLRISISHSKTHAAVMLSGYDNVGIDIEQVTTRINTLQSRIICSDKLPTYFDSLGTEHKLKYLTTLWTIKEAAYKSISSQDNVDMLKDIVITSLPDLTAKDLVYGSSYHIKDDKQLFLAKTYFIDNNCCTYTIRE